MSGNNMGHTEWRYASEEAVEVRIREVKTDGQQRKMIAGSEDI